MRTPEQVANEVFDKNWNKLSARQLMAEAIREDRKQIALMLQQGADEWEATGDDEKFVNEVVDPFIVSVLKEPA